MRRFTVVLTVVLCTLATAPVRSQTKAGASLAAADQEYSGACDGSTAIAVGPDRLLVANDDENVLRLYRAEQSGPALKRLDISGLLTLVDKKKEADIEGSALLAGTVYWITSHGRNTKGEIKHNRYQLVALTPRASGDGIVLEKTGAPYTGLLKDLNEKFGGLKLDSLDPKPDPARAPEAPGGTNIEGLCAWQGSQLLIGFRNPIPDGRALLIPLLNPAAVVQGKGEEARFGEPIRWDLGGRGIRSIELWPERKMYLIIAGPFNSDGDFRLYRWSGELAAQPVEIPGVNLSGLNPEAIVIYPGRSNFQLLSDDGDRMVGDKKCKDADEGQKTFRGRWISLP